MDPRLERIARNEALFRRVNEAIEDVSERLEERSWTPEDGSVEFHCECGRDDCDAHVAMDPDEYESIHGERDRFVVHPEHVTPEIEHVVRRTDRYVVVDKRPGAEELTGG